MNCKSMNINCAKISTFVILIVTSVLLELASACQDGYLMSTGITQEERRLILEEHNRLRQTVAMGYVHGQPAAANMQEMRWDDELAVKAQQWANQCTFQHDPSRYLSRFIMGQNLGLLWSTAELAEDDENFPSRIRNWFNEVQKYAWGAKWSVKTGHYSQLVWGSTNLVGCGFSYYYKNSRYNKLYVCNYGPGGNVINQMPYETGYPKCRTFGMSDSAKYPGLCKPYGLESNAVDDYAELTYNSINPPQPEPPSYYTYKTLNGEYDGKVDKSFGLISNNDNGPPSPSRSRVQVYNTNPTSNSAAYFNGRRQDAIASSPAQQRQQQTQQIYNNHQQNYRTITTTTTTKSPPSTSQQQRQRQPLNQYQLLPLQRNPPVVIQQQQIQELPTQRRTFDKDDPHKNQMEIAFKTYRWDLLFKKNHL